MSGVEFLYDTLMVSALDEVASTYGLLAKPSPFQTIFLRRKPNDQWNALVGGQLDMTSLPLDYASGKVGAFSATLMPGPGAQP